MSGCRRVSFRLDPDAPGRHLRDRGCRAELEELLARGGLEHVDEASDDSGPSGLVARAEPGAVVAVEVLAELDEIPPVGVLLELPSTAVDRPPALPVPEEDVGEAARDLFRHLVEIHLPSRTGRALHL